MRGADHPQTVLFSYRSVDERIPADHPLRRVRMLTDAALLQAFYTVRSERQLMEQLDYNLLFRWFVGLSADDPVWDATVFCKNRDRLLDGGAEPAAGTQAAL